ncbi:MAG: cyclic nucleotide-binding/CBS domain-containing protein [Deltaproteobacteria bacterium]|nr:cyclic nucleotide-binding/CBS domain-containing protein [Deltaproteobacteria bacterium]
MPQTNDLQAVSPEIVLEFLQKTLPFNELERDDLKRLARQCIIDFYPKNTLIFKQDVTEVTHFHLIQKGGVKIYLKDEQGQVTLKDFRGEGEYFGALPLIQNTRANLNVETVEDTFCFLFHKEAFMELLQSAPKVTHYFLRSMSEKLVRTAYKELRQHRVSTRTEGSLYLFSAQVGAIVKGGPQTIDAEDTVQNAAITMARLHIGSLLVKNGAEDIIGIVTDKDLRTRVVAQGLDYQTKVREIMAAPVQTIDSHAVCFDALLKMMSNRIHHLAISKQGKITGVVTTHDIMVLQGTSPLYLFREILAQRRIEDLYQLSLKVPLVVRSLVEEGAKANNITRMITILNDQILDRLLTLMIEKMGAPPAKFCWMLMGSEGRREQTFRTDQDNALIIEIPEEENRRRNTVEYFKIFSEEVIEHLVQCGYPRCPGNIMASNEALRTNLSGWIKAFDNWMSTPNPQEVLNTTIFFDFRAGYGDESLARNLRKHLCYIAPGQEIFLTHLAKFCLNTRPPLSFFKNFIVEKNGEHKNRLNLKESGLVPFVDFARIMALKHGIAETNTMGRMQLLREHGHVSQELYNETVEAYEFLMQLRLIHQLQLLEDGMEAHNYINPAELSDLEKQTLKEAFEVIRNIQASLTQQFRLREI